jgi:hypothetical protein
MSLSFFQGSGALVLGLPPAPRATDEGPLAASEAAPASVGKVRGGVARGGCEAGWRLKLAVFVPTTQTPKRKLTMSSM